MHETREDFELRVERLKEIRYEMLELLGEARELIKDTDAEPSAEAYWLPSVEIQLTNTHGYVGGSMCSMEDTIAALEPDEEEEACE